MSGGMFNNSNYGNHAAVYWEQCQNMPETTKHKHSDTLTGKNNLLNSVTQSSPKNNHDIMPLYAGWLSKA